MRRPDALEEPLLRDLVGARLDHDHRVLGADDDQIQVGDVALAVGRVEDDLVVDEPDANRADRVVEGNLGEHQRGRGAIDRHDVGVVLAVGGENERDDLGLHPVSGREQGAQRPVDQATGNRLLLGRAPFALEEASGNPAGGVGVFAIVDGERQKVSRKRALLDASGDQDDGVAEANQDRAVGLLGEPAGLEGEGPGANRDGLRVLHQVGFLPSAGTADGARRPPGTLRSSRRLRGCVTCGCRGARSADDSDRCHGS